MLKATLALLVCVAALTACDKKDADVATAPQVPEVPSMTMDQLLAMNKNERAEMERRCLGISNKTCNDFKGEQFKTSDGIRRSGCMVAESTRSLGGLRREAKCEVYF